MLYPARCQTAGGGALPRLSPVKLTTAKENLAAVRSDITPRFDRILPCGHPNGGCGTGARRKRFRTGGVWHEGLVPPPCHRQATESADLGGLYRQSRPTTFAYLPPGNARRPESNSQAGRSEPIPSESGGFRAFIHRCGRDTRLPGRDTRSTAPSPTPAKRAPAGCSARFSVFGRSRHHRTRPERAPRETPVWARKHGGDGQTSPGLFHLPTARAAFDRRRARPFR
jgi:hypothetical protein